MAAAARLAGGRRRGPARLPPPRRRGRGLGRDGAPGQRAVPRASGWPARPSGRTGTIVELTGTEQAFLDASRVNAERELRAKARSNRRLRLALAGVGCAARRRARRRHVASTRRTSEPRRSDEQRTRSPTLAGCPPRPSRRSQPDLAVLLGLQAVRARRLAGSPRVPLRGARDRRATSSRRPRVGLRLRRRQPRRAHGRRDRARSASDVQGQTTYDARSLTRTGGSARPPDARARLQPRRAASGGRGRPGPVETTGPSFPTRTPCTSSTRSRWQDVGDLRWLRRRRLGRPGRPDVQRGRIPARGRRLAGHRTLEAMVWDTDRPASRSCGSR